MDHFFQFYTADVDEETIGALGVLKSLERDIELTAPEVISAQKDLIEKETPEQALAKTGKGVKQTKGQALAAVLGQEQEAAASGAKKDEVIWPFPGGEKNGDNGARPQ